MNTRTQLRGSALFVGQLILDDIARVKGEVPTRDMKEEALEKAFQAGGNTPVAARACAELGFKPDLVSGIGYDLAGAMLEKVVRDAGIHWHPHKMQETPSSIVIVNEFGRVIISPPAKRVVYDVNDPYPKLDITGCRIVHVDGRNFDAALHYVKEARNLDVPTSIDAGKRRSRGEIEQLLPYIDYAVVSERYCHDIGSGVDEFLTEQRKRSKMVAVTLGKIGLRYIADEDVIVPVSAFAVDKQRTVDENGSGDIFNGARIFSQLNWPRRGWEWHFRFANAAVAWKIQRFGNMPPTLEQVYQALRQYGIKVAA